MSDFADELAERIRWVDGHADVWPTFADESFFPRLVAALAKPYRDAGVTKVAGIEARGFILGAAVALELRAGFVAIRKESGLFPGEKLSRMTPPDYRRKQTLLRLQKHSLREGDRVLLVDDWFETGSQALTAKRLIEQIGAELVGTSVIVDELGSEGRAQLPRFTALVQAEALGPSG